MGRKKDTKQTSMVEELPNESEDEDFKPRRSAHSKRTQQGTCSKSLSYDIKVKKISEANDSESKVKKIPEANDSESKVKKILEAKDSESKVKKISEAKDCEKVGDQNDSVSTRKTRSKAKNMNEGSTVETVEEAITPRKTKKRPSGPSSSFCPICQVPLNILKISAATHTATCSVTRDNKECPDGSLCLNSNMFHYRDFTHEKLAAFRVSEEYIEPDVIFTPQKGKPKHTPLKTSSGKKRLSKSPMSPPATKIRKKASETPESSSSQVKSQQLLSENHCDKEFKGDCKQEVEEPKTNSTPSNEGPGEVGQQNSEDTALEQSSLWCSDLLLEPSQTHLCVDGYPSAIQIKTEPESQNLEENAELASTASTANIVINYDAGSKEKDQNLIRNQVACSAICTSVSKFSEVFQANCSISIRAAGINPKEAIAQSPVSVTLAVNSTGWEALEIKGKTNTNIQKIEISLCKCSHSMSIECGVNNSNVSRDSKFNLLENLEEKFFATMEDMGLKSQQPGQALTTDAIERRNLLLQNCNRITISPSNENSEKICTHDGQSKDIGATWGQTFHSEETSSQGSCEQTGKVVNAFTLLKSATAKRSDSSGSSRSTPTPVPMVVAKSSHSSWTLVPGDRNYNSTSKKVPAYKKIPDTPFVVDAFNYGVIPGIKVYFLSHFHSDHFMGLRKNFNFPIFCSQITANLVNLQLRVDKQYLHILKVGEPRVVCGVEVEVYDANHCPGAIMFLFRLLDGRVFLHVGDFRAHPRMEKFPELRHVDKLYLDTTYCDPSYDFPYQEDVVDKVVETVRGHLTKNKSTLIVCGTYTIGKEKVFLGIAEAFNLKIWCTGDKRKIYKCLEDKVLTDRLTTDPLAAQVHVLAMRDINFEVLQQHLGKFCKQYSQIVGFKPTGWTTSKSMSGRPSDFQMSSRGKVTIYGVPYSEHSSFSELRRFVRHVRPKDIQVTVNVSKSAEYKKLFSKWLSSNNDTNGQGNVLQYFTKTSARSDV